MHENGEVPNFNWDLFFKWNDILEWMLAILVLARIPLTLAYLKWPQAARLNIYDTILFQIVYNFFPRDAGDLRTRFLLEGLYVFFFQTLLAVDPLPSFLLTLLYFASSFGLIIPLMYEYENLDMLVSDGILISMMMVAALMIFWMTITLISRLIAQNNKQIEEFS